MCAKTKKTGPEYVKRDLRMLKMVKDEKRGPECAPRGPELAQGPLFMLKSRKRG